MQGIRVTVIEIPTAHRSLHDSDGQEADVSTDFQHIPKRGMVLTNQLIDRLREEFGNIVNALLEVNVLLAPLSVQHEMPTPQHADFTSIRDMDG